MEEKDTKTVALIGRPNVGKSTLFNRLVGKRIAIESPIAGTTRDRLVGQVFWCGVNFDLLDVAGLEKGTSKEIDQSIQEGIEIAIDQADLILFLVDWHDKENQVDKNIALKLKKSGKKVILVVNKADNIERQKDLDVFRRLGNFDIIPVSAISGSNSGDMLDLIVKKLAENKTTDKKNNRNIDCDIRLSIIGRPNVGKSTLLNSIIGQKRAVVSGEAGTTRDVVDVLFLHKNKKILISDTAGIRRPGKVKRDSIESYSNLRTEQALRRSDVAVLVIDSTEDLVALDANILGKAKEWGKGIILAINKIDTVKDAESFQHMMLGQLRRKLNFAPWLPAVFISATDKTNIKNLLDQVVTVDANRHTEISEDDLKAVLDNAKNSNFQLTGLKSLRQKSTNPPIFSLTYTGKEPPHFTQVRYLENKLRDVFPMNGTPIFIDLFQTRKR
jgi:GTP-binding protein